MALRWQTHQMPLAAGLNTKADPRALEAPALDKCRNAEFDEVGGLQTRKPYAAIDSHAGNTIADIRRLAVYDNELVAFSKDALWSYAAADGRWTERATYLAPKVSEVEMFAGAGEKTDCDRVEVGGVTVFAWVAAKGSGADGAYIAARDSETGAVVLAPTPLAGDARPRLAAVSGDVLVVYKSGGFLCRRVFDVSALFLGSVTATATATYEEFDLVPAPDGASAFLACTRSGNASYYVNRLDASGSSLAAANHTAQSDGAIAIAVSDDGLHVAVVRGDSAGGDLLVDILDASDLSIEADATSVGAISTEVDHVTAAFADDAFRVFWTIGETEGDTDFVCETGAVEVDGSFVSGSSADIVHRLGIASRAFAYDGHAFVWLAFAAESGGTTGLKAQLQNTYFLYRDDGLLVAKAAANRAGGFAATSGHLPGVQALGDDRFAWCGTMRRIVPLGDQKGYSARAPLAIEVQFDADEARRCVQLGKTLYVAGGQVVQYDGRSVAEVGFHVFPWNFTPGEGDSTTAIEEGTYSYRGTYRSDNARGERERSTTATVHDYDVDATTKVLIKTLPLHVTLKRGANTPALEFWRTTKDPPLDAPSYLITSRDPSDTTGDNAFVLNDYEASAMTAVQDNLADSDLTKREAYPGNGGALENLPPPPASIIASSQERIFLAGIAGAPHRIAYSKLRAEGELAAFHDGLTVELPPEGGPITALAMLNETLVAFKERAIYALPGEGFDNLGGGQNYGPARVIASDLGATSADRVALTPRGLLFHSEKGWYLLGGGWGVEYVGAPVCDFDDDDFTAVHVMESQHQVRCMSTSRVLCWDYLVNQWSEWTIADGLHAVLWDGRYTYAASDGATVKQEQDDWTDNAEAYGLDVETAWIKLAGLQGMQKLRRIMPLGEYRGAHRLQIRIAYDYSDSDADGPTWVDDKAWEPTPTTVGGPLQVRHGCKQKRCQAAKVRLTALDSALDQAPTTEALKLTGLAFEVGIKPGLYQRLPAAQKQ